MQQQVRMFQSRIRICILMTFMLLVEVVVLAQIVPHDKLPPKPNPPRLINDYANLLTVDERNSLERKLVAYDDSTSNQILIITVHTLNGYEADQYATEIGHYWGVGGQAKYDNGVVILVSDGTEENGKRRYFIATGYGLEGALPAITTNAIAEQFLVPNLKEKKYFEAFDQTTDAVIKAAAGEYTPPPNYRKKGGGAIGGSLVKIILVIIFIIFILLRNNRRGGGGGFMSRRGYRGWLGPAIFWPGLGGGGGGGWSGGGGGGGFGGFGGGGFGGGGSGGSW